MSVRSPVWSVPRHSFGVGFVLSLALHVGALIALASMSAAVGASAHETVIELAPVVAPPVENQNLDEPKDSGLKLGIEDGVTETETWLGFKEPTPHAGTPATIEQAALTTAEGPFTDGLIGTDLIGQTSSLTTASPASSPSSPPAPPSPPARPSTMSASSPDGLSSSPPTPLVTPIEATSAGDEAIEKPLESVAPVETADTRERPPAEMPPPETKASPAESADVQASEVKRAEGTPSEVKPAEPMPPVSDAVPLDAPKPDVPKPDVPKPDSADATTQEANDPASPAEGELQVPSSASPTPGSDVPPSGSDVPPPIDEASEDGRQEPDVARPLDAAGSLPASASATTSAPPPAPSSSPPADSSEITDPVDSPRRNPSEPQIAPEERPSPSPPASPPSPSPSPAVSSRPSIPSAPSPAASPRTGTSGLPGERSDRESDATARQTVVDVVPGRPAAAKGLKINTVRPDWSITTQVMRSPRNPVVAITFGRSGKVIKAGFVRGMSTGSAEVDGPLLDAVYRWRAEGKELLTIPEADPKAGITVVMRIALRGV